MDKGLQAVAWKGYDTGKYGSLWLFSLLIFLSSYHCIAIKLGGDLFFSLLLFIFSRIQPLSLRESGIGQRDMTGILQRTL